MELNYEEIAERAVAYAKQNNIILDYTEQSIEKEEEILGIYHENQEDYDGEDGANALWNIAVHFGIYWVKPCCESILKKRALPGISRKELRL